MKNIEKYLKHYAEPCIDALAGFPSGFNFSNTVVIPAYKETIHFVNDYFDSALANVNSLMVLVINQPESDPNKQAQQDLFKAVLAMGNSVWQNQAYTLVQVAECNSYILILDSFSHALPEKQGVGVARKQGVDSVLALIVQNRVSSQWICSTDADASLPSRYFEVLTSCSTNTVGACFNFTHFCEDLTVHNATALYEQAMRYYVAGLEYAGSHYSFFTIGSILAFTAKAYANVRGFPKRSAGEDFYLLNKLAKIGNIAFLSEQTIKLTARQSDRVPFGTGPAVNRIIELQHNHQDYCYYPPEVFIVLKEVLIAFDSLYEHCDDIDKWLINLSAEAKACILSVGLATFINKQQTQRAPKTQFYKQLVVWFDAFKTLKFIHFARDNYYPNIPLTKALAQAPFSVFK
ncbi:hypothetical protein ACOYR1_10175 [Thalassotalea piscium]